MHNMEATDGTIYPEARIAQLDVGALTFETMAYTLGNSPPVLQFCHQIIMRKCMTGYEQGWGKIIFQGTLKELLDIVEKATEPLEGEIKFPSVV